MVPKVAHGTERVNMIKDFKVLLASKGLNVSSTVSISSYMYLIFDT
jgi:hypothetical protein